MRDHGGDWDAAVTAYGGRPGDWIDLSTGINRVSWPIHALPERLWTALPTRTDQDRLRAAARVAYGTSGPIIALAGAQQAIQLIPRLYPPGTARVLSPTYNEHAAALRAAGFAVAEVARAEDLAGADLAVVVNPNNPDGRRLPPQTLLHLAGQCGALVVDESFADPEPELSLADQTGKTKGLWVLRSFGKFYGLAGLRLGFALGPARDAERLAELAGPWPVSGPALAIGAAALADRRWQEESTIRLGMDAARLDALVPWDLVGGTILFRLYDTPDAQAAQARLARHHIWSRIFPWSNRLIRLGLPAPGEWQRLAAALADSPP